VSIDWSVLGSVGTTLAVLVAAWQVQKGTQQARTAFEDELSREYRQLARRIPVEALLGADVSDEAFDRAFPALYQYLDLTNEQIFLRMNGRIRRSTWIDWREGIRSNLARPAFGKAWRLVKKRSTNFDELRRLETTDFTEDPRRWLDLRQRLRRRP
jgi:DNA-directed RNA polymerase specialized sigma24 family protein